MKIIIVGCGKVGTALTAQLSREDNLVTVIDTDSIVVRNVSNTYDVMGIVGNGASYQVLQEADIEHADLMIAVTKSDEMNLLCCVIAKQAADCHTIARVRNPMYREEREFIRKKLGLSMIINPEHAAAMEMARLLRFPSAIEIDSFSRGRIEMLRFKVPETSKIVHMSLRELAGALQYSLLVCAVERNGEVVHFQSHPGRSGVCQGPSSVCFLACQLALYRREILGNFFFHCLYIGFEIRMNKFNVRV